MSEVNNNRDYAVGQVEPLWFFTWYRHRSVATGGLRVSWTRAELVAEMSNATPHNGPKTSLPLLCTALFRGDHRRNENVETVGLLGLDIDEPQVDPGECVAKIAEALGGVEVFACSTHSSKRAAFKLRAFVPYDEPATAKEHVASWELVHRTLERAGVRIDEKCRDPARGFYLWALPPDGDYFSAHVDGAAWPVKQAAEVELRREADAARGAREERERARQRSGDGGGLSVVERARRYVDKMPPAISGAGGHSATFAVARRLVSDFGLDDSDAWDVISDYNDRCEPPWSERELRHKLKSAQAARVRNQMVTT